MSAATSNEENRQSIPGRSPHTREVPAADNTHRGMETLLTALPSPALPLQPCDSKSSHANQVARKAQQGAGLPTALYVAVMLKSSGLQTRLGDQRQHALSEPVGLLQVWVTRQDELV